MKKMVLVPLTHWAGILALPTPWAHRPTSLEKDLVHMCLFSPHRSCSRLRLAPVTEWNTWFARWGIAGPWLVILWGFPQAIVACARKPWILDLVKCELWDLRVGCGLRVCLFEWGLWGVWQCLWLTFWWGVMLFWLVVVGCTVILNDAPSEV